jgi:hypothetical protein
MPQEMIDAEWIKTWAQKYVAAMYPAETRLLEQVGPAVARRGYYTKSDLLEVGRWKANRVVGYLGRNSDEDVEEISRIALAAPARLRHRVLCLLLGVQRPMASALLTVWDPLQYTVLDINAVSTLHRFGRLGVGEVDAVTYTEYVAVCQGIVKESGQSVTLRDLDRALWKWWDVARRL